MKNWIYLPVIILASASVYAAKITNPKCQDLNTLQEKFTPEYLAVVDGYDKAGKKTSEEVDMDGIVTASDGVQKECAKSAAKNVSKVRADVAKATQNANVSEKPASKLNPLKATCQDFLSLDEQYQPVAVYWTAGYSKAGKARKGEVDEEYLERPVVALVEDCKLHPKESFYDRAKTWMSKHL